MGQNFGFEGIVVGGRRRMPVETLFGRFRFSQYVLELTAHRHELSFAPRDQRLHRLGRNDVDNSGHRW
jgi:hypothetical protein